VRFLRRSTDQASTEHASTDQAGTEPTSTEPTGAEPASAERERAAPSAGPAPTAGKGRPTPKRREAEARRRGPVAPPPRTQREAARRQRRPKEERRAERAERRERMMAGDDRYLMPRDRGPVRAYVRDLVDSRRHLMGLFMPMAVVVLLTLFVRNLQIQYLANLALMAMLATILVEAIFLGREVNRRVRQKFPNTKDGGFRLALYAVSRATYLRRLRTPPPRVGYGELTN